MEDIGFILTTYVATFVGVIGLTWYYMHRGRRLAEQLPPEDKPWT